MDIFDVNYKTSLREISAKRPVTLEYKMNMNFVTRSNIKLSPKLFNKIMSE